MALNRVLKQSINYFRILFFIYRYEYTHIIIIRTYGIEQNM